MAIARRLSLPPRTATWTARSLVFACVLVIGLLAQFGQPAPRTGNKHSPLVSWLDDLIELFGGKSARQRQPTSAKNASSIYAAYPGT